MAFSEEDKCDARWGSRRVDGSPHVVEVISPRMCISKILEWAQNTSLVDRLDADVVRYGKQNLTSLVKIVFGLPYPGAKVGFPGISYILWIIPLRTIIVLYLSDRSTHYYALHILFVIGSERPR